jgi:ABC-type uncharacterized transport system auxiliary subunit
MRRAISMAIALALLATAGGCALFTKGRTVEIRYFSAEAPAVAASTARPTPAATDPGLELRLARVDAASYLRDRIAYRGDGAEIGYYGHYRWADPPQSYLRRALARTLFEAHGLREIVSGSGPTLEIDLDAFEELRARHTARISITWRLRGDRTILRQRTLTIERPIAPPTDHDTDAPTAIVAALTEAMNAAVDAIVSDVVAELVTYRNESDPPRGVNPVESATR